MAGWFTVEAEPAAGLIRLTMGGFFDQSGVEEMRAELVRKLGALRCGPNQHQTLCDITAMKIQSQELVAQFSALVADPAVRSRRLAFVAGATLARQQAQRLTDRDGVRFFDDGVAALAWLRSA